MARLLRGSGAQVDMDRRVPDMYRINPHDGKNAVPVVEAAILDVVACFPGDWVQYSIDVSVRFSLAERYARKDVRPAMACKKGEEEKIERYGVSVLPMIFEPHARLGPLSITALKRLASAAACTGQASTGGGSLYSMWRWHLERSLCFACADVTLRCLGAQCGRFGACMGSG